MNNENALISCRKKTHFNLFFHFFIFSFLTKKITNRKSVDPLMLCICVCTRVHRILQIYIDECFWNVYTPPPFYVPFRYFSPTEYLVISLPETPQVPMPTRPFTFSGDAKMLLIFTCPVFFAPFDVKFIHLFLSTSRSSSSSLKRCCLRCFFFFKYSLLFGRCRLPKKKWKKNQ